MACMHLFSLMVKRWINYTTQFLVFPHHTWESSTRFLNLRHLLWNVESENFVSAILRVVMFSSRQFIFYDAEMRIGPCTFIFVVSLAASLWDLCHLIWKKLALPFRWWLILECPGVDKFFCFALDLGLAWSITKIISTLEQIS